MQITVSDESGSTGKVSLIGRLDIAGAEVVALPLAALAGGKKAVIADVSGVTFLASIGIHQLVSTAKTLARRGGKLVLVGPNAIIREVLVTSGVADLMPMVSTESEAHALIG
jgi:anti-sigma B factor antagonist